MHRFFITDRDVISGGEATIVSDDLVHQMFNVLRFEVGEEVVVFDGSGYEWVVELTVVAKREIVGKILKKVKNDAEPKGMVCLYQSLLKNMDRFEWVLQKGTEVGVSEFVPLVSARCERPVVGKVERMERILKEAAEQSGRGIVPVLREPVKFRDVVGGGVGCASGEVCVIADPSAEKGLKELVSDADFGKFEKINLFVGPEGGFTSEEVSAALKAGFVGVNLGKRILRSETAGIVMAAVVGM